METKNVKIIETSFNREWKPDGKSYIIYYFNVKFDDGLNILDGQFSTNSNPQTKFLNGESYNVDIIEKSTSKSNYLFIDYSEEEKEKRKESRQQRNDRKSSEYKYVKSREEATSIITQSSYEAATILCSKMVSISPELKEKLTDPKQVSDIAQKFAEYIIEESGLNSAECKNGIKLNLKEANGNSIILQKSLKIAIQSLDIDLKLPNDIKLYSTLGMINLANIIKINIIRIANGL